MSRFMIVAAIAIGSGCVADEGAAVTGWVGASHHVVVDGTLSGEPLAFEVGQDEARDTAQFWCEREYEVPMTASGPDYASGRLVEFKVLGHFEVSGEMRRLELEFKRHDFQRYGSAAEIRVVPRVDASEPTDVEMWLEWEWHEPGTEGSRLYTAAAVDGAFDLEMFTGSPGPDGLVIPEDTGTVGGFVDASWSQSERVALSFTVDCTANKIEIVE